MYSQVWFQTETASKNAHAKAMGRSDHAWRARCQKASPSLGPYGWRPLNFSSVANNMSELSEQVTLTDLTAQAWNVALEAKVLWADQQSIHYVKKQVSSITATASSSTCLMFVTNWDWTRSAIADKRFTAEVLLAKSQNHWWQADRQVHKNQQWKQL